MTTVIGEIIKSHYKRVPEFCIDPYKVSCRMLFLGGSKKVVFLEYESIIKKTIDGGTPTTLSKEDFDDFIIQARRDKVQLCVFYKNPNREEDEEYNVDI